MKTVKCDTCVNKNACSGQERVECTADGFKRYEEENYKWCEGEGKATKRMNVPVSLIQIVVTDEFKRTSGNQSNVYLFDGSEFEVATAKCCGKEFMQVREVKTHKPVLILDISCLLAINYEYKPSVAYCL